MVGSLELIDDLHHIIEESKAGIPNALLVATVTDTLALPAGSQKVNWSEALEVILEVVLMRP